MTNGVSYNVTYAVDGKVTKEYMRLKKARYRAKHRDKHLAHEAVQTAISRGNLVRGRCEVCGEENAHAHHDDYSKRL